MQEKHQEDREDMQLGFDTEKTILPMLCQKSGTGKSMTKLLTKTLI